MKNFYAPIFILFLSFSFCKAAASDTLVNFAKSSILPGSTWKFLDDGTNQGTAWRKPGFNDAAWASGNSEIGYGETPIQNTLVSYGPSAAIVTRGPYLQMGGENTINIRWRSDVATNSRVSWGTTFGSYPNLIDAAAITTEHDVTITGLNADTKYYYAVGSSTAVQLAASNNYFITLPPANTTRKLRFAALGDCGNNSANQVDTKNALVSYLGTNQVDAMITLGDNAYTTGTDTEFQNNFFNVFQNDILRYMKLYPTPGNHDYGNNNSNTGVRNNAYYNSFTLPAAGQLGGVASGTEAYYSFNVGDVHLISLDSYGRENGNTTKMYDTAGAQVTWIKNDLAANTKKWVVVYFHHPPYTKTSHDSDAETADLGAIRERFIRILERNGVDLILNGHSHGYERSYLLKNYYKTNASDPSLMSNDFRKNLHTADSATALYNGSVQSCPYTYNDGKYNHGTVYAVSGSAGQVGGSSTGYPHKAMVYSNTTNGGSFYFEVDSNRLDAKFISYTGTGAGVAPFIRDQFTIFKEVNRVTNITVGQNDPLQINASWRGAYYWPNNGGATTQSVLPSTAVQGTFNYVVKDAAAGSCLKDSFHVLVTFVTPVMVDQFNAVLQKDHVLLNWSTSQENNNRYFTIEKSTDANNYLWLGQVNGAGTSTVTNQYRFVDYQPNDGINYYRLSHTDFNNRVKNIQVKTVSYKTSKSFTASIWQAGKNNVNILINSKLGGAMALRVTDIMGKEILQQQMNVPAGAYSKGIQLMKGIYAIQISNDNSRVIQKLVVQ